MNFGETSSWLIWPDATGTASESPDFEFQGEDVIDVHRPRIFSYAPSHPNGRAALVLAGGGYTKLVVSYEGVDVARWLNSQGIHAFLLVHRLPQRAGPRTIAAARRRHSMTPSRPCARSARVQRSSASSVSAHWGFPPAGISRRASHRTTRQHGLRRVRRMRASRRGQIS